MKNSKIAELLGVSMRRLRHMGFSLKRIVDRNLGTRPRGCGVRIIKEERQV